jgi:hypothetical protein
MSDQLQRATHDIGMADHERPAPGMNSRVVPGAGDDLGPDSRRVAHRDGN